MDDVNRKPDRAVEEGGRSAPPGADPARYPPMPVPETPGGGSATEPAAAWLEPYTPTPLRASRLRSAAATMASTSGAGS
jgi:hypothetical protein